jgi:hypothetical protein
MRHLKCKHILAFLAGASFAGGLLCWYRDVLTVSDLANIATAIGVAVAAWQIRLSKQQAVTSFEDSLAKEYRELLKHLSTKALLGELLTEDKKEDEDKKRLDAMYHYFDLCNEQAFQAKNGRISKKTWIFWKEGITTNLKRPAFERAWSEIASSSNDDFSELRAIVPPKPQKQPNALGT